MPLRTTCGHCGRELFLEEVFSGTFCRCRYCRKVMPVPADSAVHAARVAGTRPDTPLALIDFRHHAALPPAPAPRSPTKKKLRTLGRLASHTLLVSLMSIVAVAASVAAWQMATPRDHVRRTLAQNYTQPAGEVNPQPTDSHRPANPALALATADPLKTYFGFSLTGETIGYIVDADEAMAPYIEQVALATNVANSSLDRTTHRYGVVLAANVDGRQITEIADPNTDLAGATSILTSRLPGGRTDLARALGKANDWYASQLFLVMAKPIDERELAVLAETAQQTGAKVNVIALGAASRQDLSFISESTGGQYLSLTNTQLADWSAKVLKAAESRP